MPQKINLNVPPYNDDFDASKNYYKVLFRPGYSIQARELTNLQSILQNQIENIGRSRFKQGQQVIPGEVSFNKKLDYVKLASVSEVAVNINGNIVFQKYDISNLVGATIQGLTSGVSASVISYAFGNNIESDILFVKYTNSGNSSNESTFRQGETLEALNITDTPTLVVGTDGSVLPTTIDIYDYDTGITKTIDSPAMGYASAVKVESGVYFINGYFVNNAEELIIVDKYYDKPSVKVGFNIIEKIATPEEDATLYDNAKGFSNFSAPGSHRLSISLNLVANELNAINDVDYVQLVTIKNGEIQQLVKQADYNLIEETLARRTYDESGDYVVDNFSLDLREYYQRDNNKGIYPLNEETNLVNNKPKDEAKSLMVSGLGTGKAYIKGYEVVNKDTKYINVSKARETLVKEDTRVKSNSLSYFNVTNVYGSIPLNAEGQDLTAYPTLYLNSAFNDGSIGFNNTESSTDTKQTLNRRGKTYSIDDGIVTITLANPGSYASRTFPSNAEFGSTFTELWYVVNFGTTPATTTVNKVELLSYSIVKRPLDLDSNTAVQFLELTVKGDKEELYYFLREYDEADPSKRRKLFATKSDAQGYYFQSGTPTIFPYSEIFDYNDVITPVVGVAKPKDFSLISKGTGFNSDIDLVLSKGRITNGSTTYNSIFRLAYFNPNYFTKIVVDSDLNSNVFKSGKYIVGATSGAYGVVEGSSTTAYTVGNTLFVKVLSGEFLPGETITDEAGNSRRIARNGTISHFIVLKRGEGYPADSQIKINGVTYSSSAVELKLFASGIYRVNIKDRNLVAQTYSAPPSISFDTGNDNVTSEAVILPVLYRNTVYTYNSQNIKSIDCIFGSGNAYKFTCDVETFGSSYVRTKILTDFTFSGKKGSKYLECNGFSGDPSNDLSQGDIIQYTDVNNLAVRNIVLRVDKAEGLVKSRIYLDNVLTEDVSNASVVKVSPVINNSSSSSLLIPTGSKYVESIVKSPDDSGIKYNFRRDFVTTASTSGGTITFAAQLPYGTQRFSSFTESNFLLTILNKKSATNYNGILTANGGVAVNSGDIIYLKPDQVNIINSIDDSSGLTSGSVGINLPSTFFGTDTDFPILKLTATVEVSKSRPRLKTVNRNKRILIVSPGDRVVSLRGLDYDSNSTDLISYSDVFKIRYIYEGTLQTPPVVSASGELVTGTDVTERFTFDDGQRDTFYDVSRLILKPGFTAPVGQLIVSFDYFEHSQGDFCTVDSYLHEAGVSIEEVPTFNSVVYGNISLRDVFDFRPKVDSAAIVTGYQDTSLLSVTDFCSFRGSAGITSSTPSTEQNLDFTVSFTAKQYLDRIDGVFVNKKGEFFVKEGNSSLNPTKPTDVDDSLPLYYLYIPAYTTTPDDVKIIPVDNRRYTMRDIGKLEKRIERLEQYTLLSVLEQQALNMQVKDDIGIDRFKSGFIVDNFENHAVGNLASIDYRCAIDTQQSTLRPRSIESSLKLREIQERDEQRTLNGYKKTGDIITLPYTSISAISNNFATKTLSVNPFVVSQYVGEAKLFPNIDQWYDDTEKPLILDNDSKVFSVFYAKSDSREGFSSLYNNYIVNWIGTNRVFFNVNSLTDISSISSSSTTTLATKASSSNISPQNNQLAQSVPTKTVGNNTVVSSLQVFCRSIPVYFNVTRMKPKSKLFVFIDGKNVDRWIAQDFRFTSVPGNSLSTFGQGLTTDENGNASGLLIVPSGYAPQTNAEWTGDVKTVQYDTTSSPLSFITGTKVIKFTSNSTGLSDSSVDSFTQTTFYAAGSLPSQPSSIISTSPAIFKGEEGIQYIDNTKASTSPNPLSQSFLIEKYPGGVFLTGLDLYFSKKSSTIPIKVYLTNIESGKPGKYIVPGSECVLNPNTYLRVYTNGTLFITKGETVTGTASGASGPVKSIIDKNNVEVVPSVTGLFTLSNDQVYTLVLDNHNGKSFIANEVLSIPSLVTFNASNATQLNVTIAKDSGRISSLEIANSGTGYESVQLTVESPQLVGGINATANCLVSGGKIYDVSLGVGGSGYTEAPSVIIKGTGLQAANGSVKALLTIDTPAVRMGVAVDPGTTAVTNSTTPTRFNFEYPVYLQNNTEYAFAVESDSTDYVIWASKLGENEISTNSVVTSQPLLGSVFKSQNVDTWSEDLFEDIKFTMYRAEFDISRSGIVELTNESLGYELLDENPFETDSLSDTTSTSTLFKNNNKIIKVLHRNHGFEDTGKSYVSFKNCSDVGGISSETLNSTLFTISNSGLDFYNINPEIRASSNDVGGGSKVLASYNRKYEKLHAQVAYLNFSDTSLDAEVKTVNILPVDSGFVNYTTYSQTSYEKTFLNEDHFFNNQKLVASRINELVNSTSITDRSLLYKLSLQSKVSYLSPVIDLRSCSVKLINNQVEKPKGDENRYGRRDQVIKFYPIYKFVVTGTGANTINFGDASNPKIVTGNTSQAQAILLKLDSATGELYVKMLTDTLFVPSEGLTFVSQSGLTTLFVSSSGVTDVLINFPFNSVVSALDKTDVTKAYTNIISGRVVLWDAEKRELRISNNKKPINNDYFAASTTGSAYARAPFAGEVKQFSDIFRVNDLLTYENQPSDTKNFLEIKNINYSSGVLFVPEIAKNSSSIAKYITKEISLETPSTGLDVKLTANLFEEDDILIMYKIKPASSQFNFDDLGWQYFNETGTPDERVIPSSNNTIAGYIEEQESYKEYKYSISNLSDFTSFAIKIVMRSSNPVFVPKIQDIRIVASYG